MAASLEEILEYRNINVVESFMESLDIEREDAEQIFEDMLIFLWLSSDKMRLCVIDSPITIIDEMWHQFILYSKPYDEFCKKYLGRFLHHFPTPPSEAREIKNDPEKLRALEHIRRERYEKIYDLIGKIIFIRWFHEYPKKYSKSKIRSLRRK